MLGYSEIELFGLTLLLFSIVSLPGIFLGWYLNWRKMHDLKLPAKPEEKIRKKAA